MVYSQQLTTTQSARAELQRAFEPEDIRALNQASDRDLTIDGPTLAAEAFRHKLVDRVFVLLCPVIIGSGLGFWPRHRCDLNLDQDRKSTRLNSSHVSISYAVFCLKKKTK